MKNTFRILVALYVLAIVIQLTSTTPIPTRQQTYKGTQFEQLGLPYIGVFTEDGGLGRTGASSVFVPTGTIALYFSDDIPEGWHLCDGSLIPDTDTYTDLRFLLGTTDTQEFRFPDLRGLTPIGTDVTNPDLQFMGDIAGVASHTLNSSSLARHHHELIRSNIPTSGSTLLLKGHHITSDKVADRWGETHFERTAYQSWSLNKKLTETGTSTPASFDNIQPSLVLNYIIKI